MSDRPPGAPCGVKTAYGTPCKVIADKGQRCPHHGGRGRTPKPDPNPPLPDVFCVGAGYPHRARFWVDGKPYCRTHARITQAALYKAAAEAEWLERQCAAPDWLPAELHAEWRQIHLDMFRPQADDAGRQMFIKMRAVIRRGEIEVEFGVP